MKIAALVIFCFIPVEVLADQYACYNHKRAGRATVDASSMAEAQYKFKELFGQNSTPVCQNLNVTESSDIFVRDVRFSHNMQLRPYVPADLKPNGKDRYACASTGGFLADNDRDYGSCSTFTSNALPTEWKIRFISGGTATKVWRRKDGEWALWAEFSGNSVANASPQAQQYAASHGAITQTATPQRGGPTDTSVPSTASQNPIEDALKKGVGDLLKGIVR